MITHDAWRMTHHLVHLGLDLIVVEGTGSGHAGRGVFEWAIRELEMDDQRWDGGQLAGRWVGSRRLAVLPGVSGPSWLHLWRSTALIGLVTIIQYACNGCLL